jgi:hypothetical protein
MGSYATNNPDPYDDYDDDEQCDHDDEDMDILSGYAFCWRCGSRRSISDDEIKAQEAHEAAYARMEAQWNRWQWWRELKAWASSLVPRRRHATVNDDDIPF